MTNSIALRCCCCFLLLCSLMLITARRPVSGSSSHHGLGSPPPAATGGPCDYSSLHPRRYGAHALGPDESIAIDGALDDPAWEAVAFSAPFVDIQGPRHWSQPWFTTRVKLRYDARTLYIGAVLEETEVWANVTRRNAVIFRDNDFEVFVDADGTTHNYKEIEVNARNATWNLWLNRPYRDGGHENSTRVDPARGFDMVGRGMRTAVGVPGPLGDPTQRLHAWSVEMALPLVELARHTEHAEGPFPPTGRVWRINFSRVEWQVRVEAGHYAKVPGRRENNWVWSPQYAVDMHRPEYWGYLHFIGSPPPPITMLTATADREEPPLDPTWSLRFLAFQFYYAQVAYRAKHGRFAGTWDQELRGLVPVLGASECILPLAIELTSSGDAYHASLQRTGNTEAGDVAWLQSDGLIHVRTPGQDALSVE